MPSAASRSTPTPRLLPNRRASELFGLKWIDVNFNNNEISVTRSIVNQVIGSCKTEASQKPVPLDPLLAKTLRTLRANTRYKTATDWVFASPYSQGRKPYWCQSPMRNRISVVARWHHEENRVAYVPPHLRNALAGERR